MTGSGRNLILLATAILFAGCTPTSPSGSKPGKPVDTTPVVEPVRPLPPPVTEDIKWERLDIGMEPDSVFQPWMLNTSIKALEGKPVRIKGWMNGAVFTRSNIRNFHLMREKECPFGPGGQAHHAIEIELQGKLRTDFTTEEVTIEGIFRIAPVKGENGFTWSLYKIEGIAVK